jgi:membrane protease YdiL (CAAX protease family)
MRVERSSGHHPGFQALLELGILFLPAIPAYLWFWPNITQQRWYLANAFAYLYVLAGTLWIGLRRWRPKDLGLNPKGFGLSLTCGLLLIAGRTLIILAVGWQADLRPISLVCLAGEALFYIGLVGLVEELLFRGLVYHALETLRGENLAIWGSSLAFLLWHIFGQGPLIGLAALFYGLIFALVRWRAGGIAGLILVHGLMDLSAVQILPSSDVLGLGRPQILHPGMLLLGCLLLLAVPLGLWLLYPLLQRLAVRFSGAEST